MSSRGGNKTPLKGSFVGGQNSHTSSIQNFNSNFVTIDGTNDKQISPISSQKVAV